MTAIVGILNKRGIAIAADSASTLKNKIINTGNKMLRLSDRAPIAVMVVNNSSLAGIPWEVIIRWYRKESGQEEFKTMQEYISSFYAFVQNKVLSRSDIQDDKTISLENCCAVAGLGGKPRYRDGSVEYYLSEPIIKDDPKGIGPIIMAAIELSKPIEKK